MGCGRGTAVGDAPALASRRALLHLRLRLNRRPAAYKEPSLLLVFERAIEVLQGRPHRVERGDCGVDALDDIVELGGEGCGNFPRTLGREFVHSRRDAAAQLVERAALILIGIRDLRDRIERQPVELGCLPAAAVDQLDDNARERAAATTLVLARLRGRPGTGGLAGIGGRPGIGANSGSRNACACGVAPPHSMQATR